MSGFSNQPSGLDRLRIEAIRPVDEAIKRLGLPLIRQRKLGGIQNALEMQIEDGGDDPEVNALLMAALRKPAVHQVGPAKAAPLLRAIEVFERGEQERWEKVRRGIPLPRSPLDTLDELTYEGSAQSQNGSPLVACARLEAAWEIVKQLCGPDIRTSDDFYEKYGPGDFVINWFGDWLFALEVLGEEDSRCLERRDRAVREFMTCFPDEPEEPSSGFEPALEAAPPWPGPPPVTFVPPLGRVPSTRRKPGRNDPCWCGSGRKYKVCHLRADRG